MVLAGESAIFHAGIEGAPQVQYQWRFMEAAIPGKTNETLTLASVQATDEGPYSVVITDHSGATVSNPGWLFVVAPPAIVQQPASRTNVVGSSATFHVVAASSSLVYYQWRKNGVEVPGAYADSLTIGSVTLADQAGYDVVYAIRSHRQERLWKRMLFASFHRILAAISATPIPVNAGNFSLMDARVRSGWRRSVHCWC